MRWLLGLVVLIVVAAGAAYWWAAPSPRAALAPAGSLAQLVRSETTEALAAQAEAAREATPEERGAYVFAAAGCLSCHTDRGGRPLAGGRALPTAFGTFYGPNITPDPVHGIGRWTQADLARALREGRGPGGGVYFPAFPYEHYSGMTDQDIADLWAYLQTVEPVAQPSRPHELDAPFGWRFLLPMWRMLYFAPGGPTIPQNQPEVWRRGAYLVEVMGHCGACHTPRTALGALDHAQAFGGGPMPVGTGRVPNITPSAAGIRGWSVPDITSALSFGMLPDGDFLGGDMGEVVQNSTGRLTPADREAIAVYLLSLPPR